MAEALEVEVGIEEEVLLNMGPVEEAESAEEESTDVVVVREGDIFVYKNSVIALTVLSVSNNTKNGVYCKVRLYSVSSGPIDTTLDDLLRFIEDNNLTKLTTFRDQIEEVGKVLFLKEGDVFTKNGEFFMADYTHEVSRSMDDMVGQLADLSGYFESFFNKEEGKTSSKA